MQLYEVSKREIDDPIYKIRWDYLRFECSPSALMSAQGEECPQREMAREIIKIMYDGINKIIRAKNEIH